jgi:hypothetical protein
LLHRVFTDAPLLGSLLNPSLSIKNDLATSSFETLQTLMEQALSSEQPSTLWGSAQDLNEDAWDLAISARGLLESARLLDQRYHLVMTNVPYLARGKQTQTLKDYCEQHYPNAKNDLANVFLERCLELCNVEAASRRLDFEQSRDGSATGVVQIVMPQNWLFLTSYKKQREDLLRRVRWDLLARLGPGAFETISGEVVQAVLLTQTNAKPDAQTMLHGVDASAPKSASGKAELLRFGDMVAVSQLGQLKNPDARVALEESNGGVLLAHYAFSPNGLHGADSQRFRFGFWEVSYRCDCWDLLQTTSDTTQYFSGQER